MIDRFIADFLDDAAIGKSLGKGSRTGRRIRVRAGLPTYCVAGKKYVKRLDWEQWLEGQRLEATEDHTPNLKSLLREISQQVLQKRYERRTAAQKDSTRAPI